MVLNDGRVKIREISMVTLWGRVCHILTEGLGIKKRAVCWMPYLLIQEQNRI